MRHTSLFSRFSLAHFFLVLLVGAFVIACGSSEGGSKKSGPGAGGGGGEEDGPGGSGGGGEGGAGGEEPGASWLDVEPERLRIPLRGELEVQVVIHRSEIGEGDVRISLGSELPAGVTIHADGGSPFEDLLISGGESRGTLLLRAGDGVEALERPTELLLLASAGSWSDQASLRVDVSAVVTSSDEVGLRDLLDEALAIEDKPTIRFQRGLSPESIELSAPLVLDDDLAIVGWGDEEASTLLTLQSDGAGRVLEIGAAEVRLSNLRVVGGISTGNGGCIFNEGNLTLENVEIEGCVAAEGGGLYSNGPVTITGSRIQNNLATSHGGGAFLRATQMIEDSVFVQNTADQHGGGLVSFSTLEMSETDFVENSALGLGGAIRVHGVATIAGGTFRENQASQHGGAISQGGSAETRISGGLIENNTSAQNGGGIYGHEGSGLIVEGATIQSNTALDGAGIFAAKDFSLKVEGSVIRGNHGGGIVLAEAGESELHFSTVADNVGRGVTLTGNKLLSIRFSTISGNEVSGASGGGISSSGALRIVSSTIANNVVTGGDGGGLYVSGGAATLAFLTVAGNEARTGGGLFLSSSSITVNGSLIANNTAADAPDLYRAGSGSLTSRGYNLIGNLDGSYVTIPSMHEDDLLGTGASPIDPLLEDLADNGGPEGMIPTWTMELRDGSPARNAVPVEDCVGVGAPLEIDQRGVSRPVAEECDIGALESRYIPPRPL